MSVEIKKLKQEFLREALQRGWTGPCTDMGWLERAGRERMHRWFRALYEMPAGTPIPRDRFLNHFSIGADPEFIFMTGGVREDARHLGLKAGLAFGADNNGRLVELRPEPSRSALSVLTSIWLTMHWLAAYVQNTPNYIWRSGAYAEADGLGGHVHFGRKQDRLREHETRALDRITHLLYTAGCYNRDEGRLRFRQSQGGHYGHQGDIRPQPHGWEYRTFPSWLDTPWLAYLSLVLGKLAVASEIMPQLVQEDGLLTSEQARGQIRLILAYFKGLDDDARLAYGILMSRGLPVHVNGGDLKVNWGVFNGPLFSQKVQLPGVWPTAVPSVPALERELALAMLEGRLPEVGALQPTWVPNELPPGYRQLIHDVADTRLMPGVGEWCADVCHHESLNVRVHAMNEGARQFRFPQAWRNSISQGAMADKLAALKVVYDFTDIGERDIMLGAAHGNIATMLAVRQLLMQYKLLPIWPLSEVKRDSHLTWRKQPNRVGGSRALSKASTEPPPMQPPALEQATDVGRPVPPVQRAAGNALDGWAVQFVDDIGRIVTEPQVPGQAAGQLLQGVLERAERATGRLEAGLAEQTATIDPLRWTRWPEAEPAPEVWRRRRLPPDPEAGGDV